MTGIEWVKGPDNITRGITVNSKTGCLNGCQYCYAYRLAHGRLKERYLANTRISQEISARVSSILPPSDPFYPRFWPERLEQIRRMKKPTGIFLDDMSDWMGDYWPEEWTKMELQVMRDCPQHRFYTLTKQAQNLIKWSPFPENCWVGVTATSYDAFNKALDKLKVVEARIKFISIEPLLEAVPFYMERLAYCGISWLIIGACTGTKAEMTKLVLRLVPGRKYPDLTVMPLCLDVDKRNRYITKWTAQPKLKWVQEIVEAADGAGIKVFLKDNLKPLLQPLMRVPNLSWFGNVFGLRQEMPEILYYSTCRVRRR